MEAESQMAGLVSACIARQVPLSGVPHRYRLPAERGYRSTSSTLPSDRGNCRLLHRDASRLRVIRHPVDYRPAPHRIIELQQEIEPFLLVQGPIDDEFSAVVSYTHLTLPTIYSV